MKQINTKKVINSYLKTFQKEPDILIVSPGRINIIGEHIDYNDGYVLPAAIDKAMIFALGKTTDKICTLKALDYNQSTTIDLEKNFEQTNENWTNYLKGVFHQLQANGYHISGGIQGVFCSDIPIGAGLSSSAALECGLLYGINHLYQLNIKQIDIALLGQKAEHWVGIKCGIMDQFASVLGKENSVIKIDCTSLDYEYYPADFKNYSIVLFNSGVQHNLGTSEYNIRRKECEEGLAILQNTFPQVKTFREASLDQLNSVKNQLSDKVYDRCLFVIEEIERVNQACVALQENNLTVLGELMFATHWGLSKRYDVSCPELDFLVQKAEASKNIIGARVMGGGFGGCTINIIETNQRETIIKEFEEKFEEKFNHKLTTYEVKITNGTHVSLDQALV
ncbi:MAG: galactokinase [Limnohabitans sp.]|nr:galactokinase [Limnohabitans sp.]